VINPLKWLILQKLIIVTLPLLIIPPGFNTSIDIIESDRWRLRLIMGIGCIISINILYQKKGRDDFARLALIIYGIILLVWAVIDALRWI
jgi:hypothetical protein